MCFARIRCQRRRIKLPLFERDRESLKSELRQNTLPKVQIAVSELLRVQPGFGSSATLVKARLLVGGDTIKS